LTQSLSSFRSTCPNHLNLLFVIIKLTGSNLQDNCMEKKFYSNSLYSYGALCACADLFTFKTQHDLKVKSASVLWHCWLGNRKRIRPVKSWVLVFWWYIDWTFARLTAPVVTTTPSSLAPIKSRMATFWYRITQVHVETGC